MTISRYTLLLFALPAILLGFLHAPAQSLLQGIYAKHGGLALAALGTAVLITRIFDGAVDPLIGIAADAWRRRFGTYKHFVAAGSVTAMTGLWYLFRPPPDVGIYYFTGWFMVVSLGWSLVEVPYRAWSMQLSSEYVLRTRIQAWIGVATMVGTFAFFTVPIVGKALGTAASTEFDLGSLELAALIVLVTMPLACLVAILRVPDGSLAPQAQRIRLAELWRAVLQNKPLLYFTFMFLVVGVTAGVGQGVMYLFIDGYLGLGTQVAGLFLLSAPITLIGIPIWSVICQRFERQRVWAVCLGFASLSYFGFGFVPTGQEGLVPIILLSGTMMFFITCTFVAAPALVGDIVDYGRWRFGRDHAGVYISFYSVVNKSAGALGIALGLLLIDALGYDPTAALQTERGAFAIKLAAGWIPAVGIAVAVPFVWRFPLTRARHAKLLEELGTRDAASADSVLLHPATA